MSLRACARIRPKLSLLAGGDLPAPIQEGAWQHLADCASCRSEYARFRDDRDRLASIEGADPETDGSIGERAVDERFFAELQAGILAEVATTPRDRRRWWTPLLQQPMRVAGAAALLLGLAVYGFRIGTEREPAVEPYESPIEDWVPAGDGKPTKPLGDARKIPVHGGGPNWDLKRLSRRGPGSGCMQGLRGRAIVLQRLVHYSSDLIDLDEAGDDLPASRPSEPGPERKLPK
jgi:hypothetical protein